MKSQDIVERVTQVGHRARERRMHSRIESLDRDNDRLRAELGMLRNDLEEEHRLLKQALRSLQTRKLTVKTDRRPLLVRTVMIAGGAYVLGTRDGRERYEWMVQKTQSLLERMRDLQHRNGGSTPAQPDSVVSTTPLSRSI